MPLTAHQEPRLRSAFHLPRPDRSPIYKWARKNVILPPAYALPGPFNVNLSPWMKPIFDDLQDDTIRSVTVSKAVQIGGTLIADVWVPWLIVNDPGPLSWTMHTDEMMTRHAKTRFNPILEGAASVRRILPRAGPMRTTTEIYFPGFPVILNSANVSDQQSQSFRYKINDEIWHPRWQPIFNDAIARTTKFEEIGTSKVLNLSQGGFRDDVSDKAYRAGHQAEWSAECPTCQASHPLIFRGRMSADEKERAFVVWDRDAMREDGTWDLDRVASTVRFRCPHCGDEQPDTDATREGWRRTGHFVPQNDSAPSHLRSYHIEALHARPMKLLAVEFCTAENEMVQSGSEEARIKFRQKREARAWEPERRTITVTGEGSDYVVADYTDGKRAPGEQARFLIMDRQRDHRWVEIGAWCLEGTGTVYRQLWFGRVDTKEQARQLQQQYMVPDSCCAQDRRYEGKLVDLECLTYGWRGMEGVKKKTWTLRNEETDELENYPHSDPMWSSINGQSVPYFQFSGHHCKDIVANAQSGQGFRWCLPRDVNPLYLEHLKAEEKQLVRPGVWEWKEVKQNHNHGFDTSAMMVAVAVIAGLVRFTLESDSD